MDELNLFTSEDFFNFYEPTIKSYSENFKDVIKSKEEIAKLFFFSEKKRNIETILHQISEMKDRYVESLFLRMIAVREIIFCRENKQSLNIKPVWNLVAKSIRVIPPEYTISSIGSQGFLSIPLYKKDTNLESFDFIRLHIWDDSLNKYMDLNKVENFSIHSHTFFAKSWIITGEIINDRYEFINDSDGEYSFFEVVYNDSLNQVNQHSSKAINKNINTNLYLVSNETHYPRGYYEIEPSKLHKSGHSNASDCSATFFSFTGKDGLGKSFVIGPKSIKESEINRKVKINPITLINKIDSQLEKDKIWVKEN